MVTPMALCPCSERMTQLLDTLTKVVTSDLGPLLFILSHGTPMSLISWIFVRITARRRFAHAISSMLFGFPTSCKHSGFP